MRRWSWGWEVWPANTGWARGNDGRGWKWLSPWHKDFWQERENKKREEKDWRSCSHRKELSNEHWSWFWQDLKLSGKELDRTWSLALPLPCLPLLAGKACTRQTRRARGKAEEGRGADPEHWHHVHLERVVWCLTLFHTRAWQMHTGDRCWVHIFFERRNVENLSKNKQKKQRRLDDGRIPGRANLCQTEERLLKEQRKADKQEWCLVGFSCFLKIGSDCNEQPKTTGLEAWQRNWWLMGLNCVSIWTQERHSIAYLFLGPNWRKIFTEAAKTLRQRFKKSVQAQCKLDKMEMEDCCTFFQLVLSECA